MLLGRIFGVIFGFLLFKGPGVLLGFFLGYLFDRMMIRGVSAKLSPEEQAAAQQVFMKALFMGLGHLAKADGHVSVHEIEVAKSVMAQMQLDEPSRLEAIALFGKGKTCSEAEMAEILTELKKATKGSRSLLHVFMQFQIQVAFAEGDPSVHNIAVLSRYATALGFSRWEFDRLYAMHRAQYFFHQQYQGYQHGYSQGQRSYSRGSSGSGSSGSYQYQSAGALTHAYGVLGLKKGATKDEVKKAYRKLMNEYHPDKLVSKGLPESMMKSATEKAQEIGQAYELILKDLE